MSANAAIRRKSVFIPKNDLNGVTVGIAVNGQEVFKTQADNKRNCPDHVCICRVCTPERVKHDRKRQAHVHVLVQEIVVIVFQHFSGRVSLPAAIHRGALLSAR